MAQKEVEVILTRQLASYLALPFFLVDTEGKLIYFNEPAEHILGRQFEEIDEMAAAEWTILFTPTDETGQPLPADNLPLMVTLRRRWPSHGRFWIQGLDHVARHIEVITFPLIGQADRYLGAVALFWELPPQ